MLYNEFIEGTGCKDNDHNYKVYKDLEIMYMNSDMSKAEIYEYGKKLVDNSSSESEIKAKAEIKAEIQRNKETIEWMVKDIERYQWYLKDLINTKDEEREYKDMIKRNRERVRSLKAQNRTLRDWFL